MLALVWVRMAAKYAENPKSFSLNAVGKLNAVANKLGFSPVSRQRLGAVAKRRPHLSMQSPARPNGHDPERFFDDAA